ncbi:phosphatase PAP2 family protein [Aestuariibacter sp. A3R04]|uniref:phosphatase PAP2 family protein n=1 Tax=Aestuariibacter sp. A3R04 TaxID=2841571 RepID=UPI001C09707D|nr:phosphatase PAP2 family protein [Aestuariibacter sp. A3R04]MBU3021066.1 phosphatase PAP2 family protein [Aestuariibacter sp. A3R04]
MNMPLLLVLSASAFVLLSMFINANPHSVLDKTIMLWFHNPNYEYQSVGPKWLAVHFRDVTTLGSNWFVIFCSLLVATLLFFKSQRRLAMFLLLTVGTGVLVGFALKWGFHRPRPSLVAHSTTVYTSSFPSGHGMAAAMTYCCLAFVASTLMGEQKLSFVVWTAAWAIILLVGVSRVFLGVHWPTDVAAGWLAGLCWFAVGRMCFQRANS